MYDDEEMPEAEMYDGDEEMPEAEYDGDAFGSGWTAYYAANRRPDRVVIYLAIPKDCSAVYYAEWKRGWLAALKCE
jgi:hypothetical protein